MSTISSTLSTTARRAIVAAGIGLAALAPAAVVAEISNAPIASADDHGSSTSGGNHSRNVREGRADAVTPSEHYWQSHPTPPHSGVGIGSTNQH